MRTLLVAIDLKAAFDRVRRGGLLMDLAEMQLPVTSLRWIRSFLSDRREAVKGNETRSRKVVPQGSPLSLLLFVLGTSKLIPEVNETSNVTVDV